MAASQRIMNNFIANEDLSDTFTYLDDVILCGKNQAKHDKNLRRFLNAAKRKNLVYNEKRMYLLYSPATYLGKCYLGCCYKT